MDKKREKITRFSLITGEDTYASQTAQNPVTSRRLKSLIPSAAGDLSREPFQAQYNANALGGPVGSLYQFDHNDGNGNVTSFFFAASSSMIYQSDGTNWVTIQAVVNFPQFVTINNILHISDGVTNWIFTGTGGFQKEGFPIPATSLIPSLTTAAAFTPGAISPVATTGITSISRVNGLVTVVTASSQPFGAYLTISGVTDPTFNGTFKTNAGSGPTNTFTYPQLGNNASSSGGNVDDLVMTTVLGKYYWLTYADETPNQLHESSTGLISKVISGALTSKKYGINLFPGTIAWTASTRVIQGTGTAFSALEVGYNISHFGLGFLGVIVAINANTQTVTIDRNLPALSPSGALYSIAPARATNIHIYASESESSKVGFYLDTVPASTPIYVDQSPFLGQPNAYYTQINRPVRNDPAPGSGILEVHKYRVWRRRETKPNFFLYSANEEVASSINGSPQESYPGADVNTKSDIVNETSFPSQSNRLRSIVSHADALYLATEKQCLPLYGDSIDDFAISQVSAFSVGSAGRWAMISTPHGLAFMSYDRKLYLYPTSNYPWAYVPKDVNVTESLIEIGKPLRKTFEQIKGSDLDNVRLCFYNYGRRNWLVVCYQDVNSVYHTWIYDFEIKNWFELSRGFSSVGVFDVGTPSRGKVLIGGGTDGKTYVIDDLTGSATPGVFPQGTWRPALIDFGSPDEARVARYVEFEVSNVNLAQFITVNYYLDPVDVDNPGAPKSISMSKVRGSNLYRGFFKGGAYCKRILLEFSVAANTTDGVIRGVVLKADEVSGLVF